MEIVYVTKNKEKVETARRIFKDKVKIKQISLDLTEPQSISPKEISESKARQAYEILKKPLFVTDVGFCIEAFKEFPGSLIRFFNDYVGQEAILKLLEGVENRRAKAVVSLTFFDGKTMKTFEGVTEGTVAKQAYPKGWEFDRIFIPEGSNKTWGEMGSEAKDKESYYKKAFEKFLTWLEGNKA
ncbi:MAG: non-canonical purine NTP pyrophosphatase [Candidatus Aenigmarchaeota archaeon]|nr:non-canonical purine NTP pyrophosphatase [Candidatus Aenigmarchaeota archaeon]